MSEPLFRVTFMTERLQMSTEDTTGVDRRLVTPVAQHGEDGGIQRASGKLWMCSSQFHRCYCKCSCATERSR